MRRSSHTPGEVRITVRLAAGLCERIDRLADTNGTSRSAAVREAVEQYCHNNDARPTCYDLMKQAGLIGAYSGGPSDLSTNPKYMEGFGLD